MLRFYATEDANVETIHTQTLIEKHSLNFMKQVVL